MKYLRKYNESSDDYLVKMVEDILLEIQDDYFTTKVNYSENSVVKTIHVIISKTKSDGDYDQFWSADVNPIIDRIRDCLSEYGYKGGSLSGNHKVSSVSIKFEKLVRRYNI
jgi:hypothetical protein